LLVNVDVVVGEVGSGGRGFLMKFVDLPVVSRIFSVLTHRLISTPLL
jgi:hypothetical protein